ncbi:inner nuclear membrane Man1-like, partial [Paramuricea clavata]
APTVTINCSSIVTVNEANVTWNPHSCGRKIGRSSKTSLGGFHSHVLYGITPVEVLKNHHNECQRNKDLNPYLAIPHVRDMLIKPSERESMKSAWDDAVKFLSAQESRVRVESQRIAGEDFEVWRLLHHSTPGSPSSPSGSNVKQGKVWQGTAFENFTTAVNPPLISPTPCLKIRNMFEPVMETQDQWHVFIQDAILEKCTEKEAAIVHISVDKASNEGCVYVKCANHRSSGAAFRAIHGCWFDGRLVTVKFLTLKRYHQRFPESVEAKEHLKASGMSSSTIPKLESAPVNESDSDSDS